MDEESVAKVAQFCNVTGSETDTAQLFLARHNGNLDLAVAEFFQSQESDSDDIDVDEAEPTPAPPSSDRALPGRTAPAANTNMSGSSNRQDKPKKKFGTLRDFESDNGSQPHGHSHDDDDDKDQEFYTGGDKSGLAVQDPNSSNNARDPIQRLLDTARRNGPPPPRENEEPARNNFAGRGATLGDENTPSRVVEDPNANATRRPGVVERTLHMWRDGFSVDDGPLYRYSDPANARWLDMIERGSAPLEIMDVEQGQAVDVKVDVQRETDYVQPKKKYKPFSGSGARLGSPGAGGPSGAAAEAVPSTPAASSSSGNGAAAAPTNANPDQPTVTLQVRLADGTRLPARFNTTQTVGDVYEFVNRANAASQERSYSLATTFPTKPLDDPSVQLGDMAEFKKGGVVVQKFT